MCVCIYIIFTHIFKLVIYIYIYIFYFYFQNTYLSFNSLTIALTPSLSHQRQQNVSKNGQSSLYSTYCANFMLFHKRGRDGGKASMIQLNKMLIRINNRVFTQLIVPILCRLFLFHKRGRDGGKASMIQLNKMLIRMNN